MRKIAIILWKPWQIVRAARSLPTKEANIQLVSRRFVEDDYTATDKLFIAKTLERSSEAGGEVTAVCAEHRVFCDGEERFINLGRRNLSDFKDCITAVYWQAVETTRQKMIVKSKNNKSPKEVLT